MHVKALGVVAHLDILGFQSFLDGNPPADAEDQVLKFLEQLESDVIARVYDSEALGKNLSNPHSLVFSDTIIITGECLDKDNEQEKIALTGSMLLRVSRLVRKMFEYGLPVRVAIDFGEYRVQGKSFTGAALINAYRLGGIADMAGILLSNDLVSILQSRKMEEENETFFDFLVKVGQLVHYNTPLKGGARKQHWCLNFMQVGGEGLSKFGLKPCYDDSDLRDMVLSSFWAHNKDMDEGAERKALNTELFLRYCRIKHPHTFSSKRDA